MPTYRVIDAHTHLHRTARQGKAYLARRNFEAPRSGSIVEAARYMGKTGIERSLIIPFAPARDFLSERMAVTQEEASPETANKVLLQGELEGWAGEARRVQDREGLLQRLALRWSAFNSWAAETARDSGGRFASLICVDPVLFGSEWVRKEVEMHLQEGSLGMKVAMAFIGVYPVDGRMAVLWEEADRRRLPVMCMSVAHGVPAGSPAFCHPNCFEEVLKAYPRCRIVLAHMGRGAEEDVVRLCARYPNLYCDTSSWLGEVGKTGKRTLAEAVDLFRRIGMDRVLFGTNYPISNPSEYVDIAINLPLTEAERHQFFSANYERAYEGKPSL